MRATMASAESDSDSATAHHRISRQSTRPDLILILDVDGTTGILDIAHAPRFVEVQQQEVTVEPIESVGFVLTVRTTEPVEPVGRGSLSCSDRGCSRLESYVACVDGSGWQGVYSILKNGGYTVSVVQNPTLPLEGDVAATRLIIDAQDEPVILVGQSYGGAVITEAVNDPKVSALVYIAAFAPDRGESVNTLIANPPPGAPVPPILLPPQDGFLFLDREKFHASFAADVSAELAAFTADSQVPWAVDALGGSITEPAWRVKPSWYLVATEDRMIPPPAQRFMSERAGSTVARGRGQPRDLPLAAGRRGFSHRTSRFRNDLGRRSKTS